LKDATNHIQNRYQQGEKKDSDNDNGRENGLRTIKD